MRQAASDCRWCTTRVCLLTLQATRTRRWTPTERTGSLRCRCGSFRFTPPQCKIKLTAFGSFAAIKSTFYTSHHTKAAFFWTWICDIHLLSIKPCVPVSFPAVIFSQTMASAASYSTAYQYGFFIRHMTSKQREKTTEIPRVLYQTPFFFHSNLFHQPVLKG